MLKPAPLLSLNVPGLALMALLFTASSDSGEGEVSGAEASPGTLLEEPPRGERPDFDALKKSGARESRYLSPGGTMVPTAEGAADLAVFHAEIEPILEHACYPCHGADKQKGGFRVDELDPDFVHGDDVDWWLDVQGAIGNGEMPPDGEERLSAEDRGRLLEWLSNEVQAASSVRRASREHSSFRRLAGYEYEFALRDLLGVSRGYGDELPPDPISEDGFENSSEVLHLSTTQFEAYMAAGRQALQEAVALGDRPTPLHWSVSMDAAAAREFERQARELAELTKKYKDDPEARERELAKKRTRFAKRPGGAHFEQASTGRFARATWAYYGAKHAWDPDPEAPAPRVDSSAVAVLPAGAGLVVELGDQLPEQGLMRIRVHASKADRDEERTASLRLMFGWQASNDSSAVYPAGEADHEIDAPPGKPQTYEWTVPAARLELRNLVRGVNVMGDLPSPSEYIKLVNASLSGRTIHIHHVEVVAPHVSAWPPESHLRVLPPRARGQRDAAYLRQVLTSFMERAWRRQPTSREVSRMVALHRKLERSCESFEEAVLEVLSVCLASPHFLYVAQPAEGGPLDGHELATRLSLFLWCSVPDEELRACAASGELTSPEVLRDQVARMLSDPRSARLSEVFVDQWLDLGLMENLSVDRKVHKDFDDSLRDALVTEPVAFFAELLRRDASVLELIHADFTMANERLAEYYGLEGVVGNELRPVALDPAGHRGGLLGQGGPLAMNSDGKDSHPLKRGIWVLENLLDDPPPPPPPAVPEIDLADPEIAKMTLKERLEDHRNDPACMSCHAKIDPWGIAFEHFDATGRWRDSVNGRTVDAVSQLVDGHELRGVDGLKAFLLAERQDQFVRALTHKLTTFALGRPLGFGDRAAVDGIAATTRRNGDGLATMIEAIVLSELFLNR